MAMEKWDRFRLTAPILSLVSWIVIICSIWIDWEHPVVIFGEEILLQVALLAALFGLLIHAVMVHILVFAGKALSNDVAVLIGVYVFFTPVIISLARPFAGVWVRGLVFAFIILGTEFRYPDWPQTVYKFLRKYLILAKDRLKKKRLVRNE
jgi:hypothetical protein